MENNLDLIIVPVEEEQDTAQDIIRANIERANEILDMVTSQLADKKMTGIMLQAVAKMIDSVTSAANALISAEENLWGLQIKEEMVKLQERKLSLSTANEDKSGKPNIFIGSFSDVLKQIGPIVVENENLLE